jgi:sucrose-phosphate synthase
MPHNDGKYIMLVSVHGLIRGHNLELGRDADTGGQTTYVVELARALSAHEQVERVDLVTRLVEDQKVSDDYAQPTEEIGPGARIVRVRCGPRRYLGKESLWPHLDSFVDNLLKYIRAEGWIPDLVHGHYADAGYVAARVSGVLNIPMAFTGHSLGRVKRQRLLDQGTSQETIERRYNIAQRIEAEEVAIDNASFVIASTNQEVEEQYAQYDNYQPKRMVVTPPGVDLSRFTPPAGGEWRHAPIYKEVIPFLSDWGKPMVLALSRPDQRKNITTLVRAYGEHPELREMANLCVVAGNRDDIRDLDRGAREVLTEVLMLIDRYNLYGSVAYPKHHKPEDVPDLYRLAVKTKGVFVNPALTEPFGLTLIEAAATGLPIIATSDGGPRDIIGHCDNGVLIDPLDAPAMGEAIHAALSDPRQWKRWSRNGVRGAHKHYSWTGHVNRYMRAVRTAVNQYGRRRVRYSPRSRLITADRILVADIDNTLTGDRKALAELIRLLREAGEKVAVGIATGRSLTLTEEVLREWRVPTPQLLITSVGSAIHYGRHLVRDSGWEKHISYRWQPDAVRAAMADLPGIELQGEEGQGPFKISYVCDPEVAIDSKQIVRYLRRARLQVAVIHSHNAYLDVLPIRASKGMALRYFCNKWNIPLERCLVAGDSGNDVEMLTGNTLGVVVGNYDKELERLRGEPRIYFAERHHAAGILEGIAHYDFLGDLPVPQPEEVYDPNAE